LVKTYLRTEAQRRQPRVIHNTWLKKKFIEHENRQKRDTDFTDRQGFGELKTEHSKGHALGAENLKLET
jgi:hypothetical protein